MAESEEEPDLYDDLEPIHNVLTTETCHANDSCDSIDLYENINSMEDKEINESDNELKLKDAPSAETCSSNDSHDSFDLYENINSTEDLERNRNDNEDTSKINVEEIEPSRNEFALYEDLLTAENLESKQNYDKLSSAHSAAVERISSLEMELKQLQQSEAMYREKCSVLEKNLSLLFVTAKQELKRKDSQINELRKTKEEQNISLVTRTSDSPSSRRNRDTGSGRPVGRVWNNNKRKYQDEADFKIIKKMRVETRQKVDSSKSSQEVDGNAVSGSKSSLDNCESSVYRKDKEVTKKFEQSIKSQDSSRSSSVESGKSCSKKDFLKLTNNAVPKEENYIKNDTVCKKADRREINSPKRAVKVDRAHSFNKGSPMQNISSSKKSDRRDISVKGSNKECLKRGDKKEVCEKVERKEYSRKEIDKDNRNRRKDDKEYPVKRDNKNSSRGDNACDDKNDARKDMRRRDDKEHIRRKNIDIQRQETSRSSTERSTKKTKDNSDSDSSLSRRTDCKEQREKEKTRDSSKHNSKSKHKERNLSGNENKCSESHKSKKNDERESSKSSDRYPDRKHHRSRSVSPHRKRPHISEKEELSPSHAKKSRISTKSNVDKVDKGNSRSVLQSCDLQDIDKGNNRRHVVCKEDVRNVCTKSENRRADKATFDESAYDVEKKFKFTPIVWDVVTTDEKGDKDISNVSEKSLLCPKNEINKKLNNEMCNHMGGNGKSNGDSKAIEFSNITKHLPCNETIKDVDNVIEDVLESNSQNLNCDDTFEAKSTDVEMNSITHSKGMSITDGQLEVQEDNLKDVEDSLDIEREKQVEKQHITKKNDNQILCSTSSTSTLIVSDTIVSDIHVPVLEEGSCETKEILTKATEKYCLSENQRNVNNLDISYTDSVDNLVKNELDKNKVFSESIDTCTVIDSSSSHFSSSFSLQEVAAHNDYIHSKTTISVPSDCCEASDAELASDGECSTIKSSNNEFLATSLTISQGGGACDIHDDKHLEIDVENGNSFNEIESMCVTQGNCYDEPAVDSRSSSSENSDCEEDCARIKPLFFAARTHPLSDVIPCLKGT